MKKIFFILFFILTLLAISLGYMHFFGNNSEIEETSNYNNKVHIFDEYEKEESFTSDDSPGGTKKCNTAVENAANGVKEVVS